MTVTELEYHCRRCGLIERGEIAQSDSALHVYVPLFMQDPNRISFETDGLSAAMFKVHRCADNAYGVLDFVGFKAVPSGGKWWW